MSDIKIGYWGNTTDPAHHDPGDFRYLVHMDRGLSRQSPKSGCLVKSDPRLAGLRYLDRPENLYKAGVLSASLIDNQRRRTFGGRLGLILSVPFSGVLVTAPYDVYSIDDDQIERAKERFPDLIDPDIILARTESYNEILCDARAITLSGLILLVGDWPYRKDNVGKDYVYRKAEALDVPVVEFEPSSANVKTPVGSMALESL